MSAWSGRGRRGVRPSVRGRRRHVRPSPSRSSDARRITGRDMGEEDATTAESGDLLDCPAFEESRAD
jgi:hypothetical protein